MRNTGKYFHPRKFIHNNIDFRIKTSEAIGLFKMNQSFILSQMRYNPNFEFSYTSKDVMLLKYDIWYDWINEVEQILLNNGDDLEGVKNLIIDMLLERKKYYEDTLNNNFYDNDLVFVTFWIDIHNEVCDFLINKIKILNNDLNRETFFSEISKLSSMIMKRTLYELQELETLFFDKGDVNICIDNVCIELVRNDFNSFINKIRKYQVVKPFKNVIIKNYSDFDCLQLACKDVLEYLEKNNIKYTII